IHCDLLAPLIRVRARNAYRCEQPSIGLKPPVYGHQMHEAAHEQSGANHQDQCKCYFDAHQYSTKPVVTAITDRAPLSFTDRTPHISDPAADGGHDSSEKSDEQSRGNREGRDITVQLNFGKPRYTSRIQ